MGYVTAVLLVKSQQDYGVSLIGPVRSDPSWQTRHHPKFAASNFQIDWEKKIAVCPRGHQSQTWSEQVDSSNQPIIDIRFSQSRSRACPSRSRCTRAQTQPRGLTIRTKNEHIALKNRREVQNTPKFLKIYNQRAGIEGTLSQGIRRSDLRQSRYIGKRQNSLTTYLYGCCT